MGKLFNHTALDITRLRYGAPGVPWLPTALCRLWETESLPNWLASEIGTTGTCPLPDLNSLVLEKTSKLLPRIEHYVEFLVRSRQPAIRDVRWFDRPWPRGLRMADIQFSVRSKNLLDDAGLTLNPERLTQTTFGQLLAIPGLGVKSLLEITSLVEAAIHLHEQLTSDVAAVVTGHSSESLRDPSVISNWSEALTELINEPWVEQISAEDPRFQRLLPVGSGTLDERVEKIISDPTTAPSDIPALLTSVSNIREIVGRLNSQFLEESLLELLALLIGPSQPRLNAIADRLGWRGSKPKTLQEAGDSVGITRQRVSQIENRVRDRLVNRVVLLPKLDLAITLLEAAVPLSENDAAKLLAERKISRRPFSPMSIVGLSNLLGRKIGLALAEVKGQTFVVASNDNDMGLSRCIQVARKLAGKAGVASVFQVADETHVGDNSNSVSTDDGENPEDLVRRVLGGSELGCEFLDDDWFWFTDLPEGRNRLANIANRVLSVATPQSVASIREGVRRVFRYRALTNPRYSSLTVPPQSVMSRFFQRHPDFRIDDDSMVTNIKPLDYRLLLGDGDQILVEVLRSAALGVLDRKTLVEECLKRGLNGNTLSVYSSYSPIIEHIGVDLWKLRGVNVDPAAVEAVRQQNHLRPREQRLLDYGWTADGKLWVAWRLPEVRGGLVFGVPGAVRRYLSDRKFGATAKNLERTISHVSINEKGTAYGWSPILRHIGADTGDIALAEFDLTKSVVQVSLADEAILEED
jgi:Sigma-70, region 4/Bacterial RNA polymerase, alpha chain C terminal domain